MTLVPQKDCYNVTIYIYIISISLSLRVLKRLVLHLQGYLQKNNVTEFCNKLGVFCNIVTQGKIIVVPTESYKVITFADFGCLVAPRLSPSLAHTHSRARSPAPPNYYDVLRTDNVSARMMLMLQKFWAKKSHLAVA